MPSDTRIRDTLLKDPVTHDIPNEGVANVDQDETIQAELQSFVCEGQYSSGMERILDSYLGHLDSDEQPAVWVSGFYGSGKSHFVKMLTYLWRDRVFTDGATPRGLATLPDDISILLRELSTQGKRLGGLHAAAGVLDGALPVELSLLAILFRSTGLAPQYHIARLQMRLREERVLDDVRQQVGAAGRDFDKELRNMYVSDVLAEAILQALPGFATDVADVKSVLREQYPTVREITRQEMVDTINDLLAADDRLPCTLVVLDELQQFIGDSSDKSLAVQLVTEECCKQLQGRLLFVGTGQSALSETANLQKLMGRFTLPVELSDTDVETVIRRTLLAKRSDRLPEVSSFLEAHRGEINRQLSETRIGPRPEDDAHLPTDYPILPVRQRFWERVLRAIDKPGTAAQLRTQLRMVHEALRTVADRPLGAVVPADFIFDQQSTQMKQAGILLRDIEDIIEKYRDDQPGNRLKSSLCALTFLIGELPRDSGSDIGVRATAEMLADLLVDDLTDGGADLRRRVPEALEELAQCGDLMQIGDEYRIQTRESAAWEGEFRTLYGKKRNDANFIAGERNMLLHGRVGAVIGKVQVIQGRARVGRKLAPFYGSAEPPPAGEAIPVWVRDGWSDTEASVQADAREAGTDAPTIFVYLPREDADSLRDAIAGWRAAEEVIGAKGSPTTAEGIEARNAMKSRMDSHEARAKQLAENVVSHATILLGGGSEVAAESLQDALTEAAEKVLVRMFPQFDDADDAHWDRVVSRARNGDGDCLQAVGHTGEPDEHPVCKAVAGFLSTSKKGSEVRKRFLEPPYGWPRDAVDGALLAMTVAGAVSATHDGKPLDARTLDQGRIPVAVFRRVAVVPPDTSQRMALRRLFQAAQIQYKTNQELEAIPALLSALEERAVAAGGEPPLPQPPDTARLRDFADLTGNELAVAVAQAADGLAEDLKQWQEAAAGIERRRPAWQMLERLLAQAGELAIAEELRTQVNAVSARRALLDDPDPVPPLLQQLSGALRNALTAQCTRYEQTHERERQALEAADAWQRITQEQREGIAARHNLALLPRPGVETDENLAVALERMSIVAWRSEAEALPERFSQARLAAERLLEPELVTVRLPRRKITSEDGLQEYLTEVEAEVQQHLKTGKNVMLGM